MLNVNLNEKYKKLNISHWVLVFPHKDSIFNLGWILNRVISVISTISDFNGRHDFPLCSVYIRLFIPFVRFFPFEANNNKKWGFPFLYYHILGNRDLCIFKTWKRQKGLSFSVIHSNHLYVLKITTEIFRCFFYYFRAFSTSDQIRREKNLTRLKRGLKIKKDDFYTPPKTLPRTINIKAADAHLISSSFFAFAI